MKTRSILCLLLLLAVLLVGCASEQSPDTAVPEDGTELTVDRENHTVSDGQYTYQYDIDGNTNNYTVTITYPNGATYYETGKDGEVSCGESENYDNTIYVSGSVLVESLSGQIPQPKDVRLVLAGILVLIIGVFLTLFPRKAWLLTSGWQYNAEPSAEVIKTGRILGIAMMVCGIALLFL